MKLSTRVPFRDCRNDAVCLHWYCFYERGSHPPCLLPLSPTAMERIKRAVSPLVIHKN